MFKYLHIHGAQGSGKTRTLQLLQQALSPGGEVLTMQTVFGMLKADPRQFVEYRVLFIDESLYSDIEVFARKMKQLGLPQEHDCTVYFGVQP